MLGVIFFVLCNAYSFNDSLNFFFFHFLFFNYVKVYFFALTVGLPAQEAATKAEQAPAIGTAAPAPVADEQRP